MGILWWSLPTLSSFSCEPAAFLFQANPWQLLKQRGKMILEKHPAHRAREGPAHSIKVTDQGREGRAKGPEAQRDLRRRGRPLAGLGWKV